MKIEPSVTYYKRLIKSYNNTVHNILGMEINLLLSQMLRVQNVELSPLLCLVS